MLIILGRGSQNPMAIFNLLKFETHYQSTSIFFPFKTPFLSPKHLAILPHSNNGLPCHKPSSYFPSEERLAQLNMELETTRANMLEANSSNEASNLSFEMSEADM